MKITYISAVALASLALALPASAEGRGKGPGSGKTTLAGLVAKSGDGFDKRWFDYDILLKAVKTAKLVDALDDPTLDATLFAPNDLAFIRLARDLGYAGYDEAGTWDYLVDTLTALGGGDPIPVLTDILLYHVAPESLSPLQVIFAGSIPTLQGATIEPFFLRLRDKEPDLKDPRVSFPLNVKATNGVLHTINRVLIPTDL